MATLADVWMATLATNAKTTLTNVQTLASVSTEHARYLEKDTSFKIINFLSLE